MSIAQLVIKSAVRYRNLKIAKANTVYVKTHKSKQGIDDAFISLEDVRATGFTLVESLIDGVQYKINISQCERTIPFTILSNT